ncbi:hypothetical protein [Streptomyces sp. SID3343]|uniref:hypothetical protein n=1 Tax=Streptomyces sp. SID3343 TaxID=2690260 RepID=UPI00136C1039|nr:hypothetical protein [Streptomyces sp. SID3343]MYW04998.1 hypothetical protein [Streptomyces sp. SID3343]
MYKSPKAAVTSGAALVLATLTSCAGAADVTASNSDKDARALVREARALVEDSPGYRIVGNQVTDGYRTDYDLCVRGGHDYQGSIEMSGRKADMLVVGEQTYLRGDADFWRTLGRVNEGSEDEVAEAVERFADRYARYTYDPTDPVDSAGAVFGARTDGYVKGERTRVEGRVVVPLRRTDEFDVIRTVYVAAYGKPYPVAINTSGPDPQNARLSRSERPCAPAVPPADRIVDAEEGWDQ